MPSVKTNIFGVKILSVLQSNSPTLKQWPFLLRPTQKILNLSDHPPPPPSLWAAPLRILENLTSPLKCELVQKNKDSVFKEKVFFISYNEIRTHSQEQEVRLLLNILFLLCS